jgi:hypothetical protein
MERGREALELGLYQVIPMLDSEVRVPAINLRRRIHKGQAPVPGAIETVAKALLPDLSQQLLSWGRAQQRASAALTLAEAALQNEIPTHFRGRLWGLSADKDFRRALALASPDLCADIIRQEQELIACSRVTRQDRALFSYIMRAAAKTSPFSTFLHTALLETEGDGGFVALGNAKRSSWSYLSNSVNVSLWVEEKGEEYTAAEGGAPLRLAAAVRWTDSSLQSIASKYVSFHKRLWRTETLVRIRLHAAVAATLRRLPPQFAWLQLLQTLIEAGIAGEAAEALGRKLLRRGVICLAVRASVPPSPVAGWVDGCANTSPENALARRASSLSRAGTAERLKILTEIDEVLRQAVPEQGRTSFLGAVIEDGFFGQPLHGIGDGVRQLLVSVAQALRPAARVRVSYSRLRGLFVNLFGVGGKCPDVIAFLYRASEELADPAPLPAIEDAIVPAGEFVPATVLLQLVGDPAGAPEDLLAVINKVYSGCGWLSARHAVGPAKMQGRLRGQLAHWIEAVKAPAEAVDILICSECNPLQSHPRLTRRALVWPTEPFVGSEGLVLAETTLSHDPLSDTLQLWDATGRLLAPTYLGVTQPNVVWGPVYWLTILAEPYELRRPIKDWMPPAADGVEVEHRPREQTGRVVTNRATWWVTPDRLRRTWYRRRGAAQLIDVAADCQQLALPNQVFAQIAPRTRTGRGRADHKPFWLDTRNPVCLEILDRVLPNAKWVAFTEVLPDHESAAIRVDGRRHVGELQVEMLL